jgi:predicted nucleotidyltransferase
MSGTWIFDVRRDDAIQEIMRRLIDYYHPERIYLFGSAARGDTGPDSDLDFCVILPGDAPKSAYKPASTALWALEAPPMWSVFRPGTSICGRQT